MPMVRTRKMPDVRSPRNTHANNTPANADSLELGTATLSPYSNAQTILLLQKLKNFLSTHAIY